MVASPYKVRRELCLRSLKRQADNSLLFQMKQCHYLGSHESSTFHVGLKDQARMPAKENPARY